MNNKDNKNEGLYDRPILTDKILVGADAVDKIETSVAIFGIGGVDCLRPKPLLIRHQVSLVDKDRVDITNINLSLSLPTKPLGV